MTCIRSTINQKHFKTFSNVEQLFLKACEGQNCEEEPILYADFFFRFNKDDSPAVSQSVSKRS